MKSMISAALLAMGMTSQAWCAMTVGTTWQMTDAYDSGNNPSGPWKFMYVATGDTTFDPANYTLLNERSNGSGDQKWWRTTGNDSFFLGRYRALASTSYDVALVWTAPDSGYVDFDGSARYAQPQNGTMKFFIDAPDRTQTVYTIQGTGITNPRTQTWHVSQVYVEAGDTITIRISADGNVTYDGLYWMLADGTTRDFPRVTVVAPVPEAESGMLGLGMLGVAALGRKKRVM